MVIYGNRQSAIGNRQLPTPWTGAPWPHAEICDLIHAGRYDLYCRGIWWNSKALAYARRREAEWSHGQTAAYLVATRAMIGLFLPDWLRVECERLTWNHVNTRIALLCHGAKFWPEEGLFLPRGEKPPEPVKL